MRTVQCLLVVALLLWQASASPALVHEGSPHPALPGVSELTTLVASRPRARLGPGQEARLPLPTPQDIEAIKKVAQILAMLGEQVIPAIIGEPAAAAPAAACDVDDPPGDPVDN